MAHDLLKFSLSFLLLFVVNPFSFIESITLEASEQYPFTKTLQNLEGVQKGQTVKGVSQLKNYLKKFGYLTNDHSNDHFDENLESALKDYQMFHNIDITGRVDATTIKIMSQPRCGVHDTTQRNQNGLIILANYSFFPGSPKWGDTQRSLTYTYKSSADVLSMDIVRQAVENAFESWSKVTDFIFTETGEDDPSDIVIGFHRGDHGDGYPFDGPGSVLAHTFAPKDGRLHYDADEEWTNNPNGLGKNVEWNSRRRRRRPISIDLETVALHEIGHLIGLGHSSNPNSVMFPSYGGELILGGTDSTSTTLTWAMSLLLRNPLVLEKAKEEINTQIKKESLISESDINKLVYLQAIVKETLRLYPPAPLSTSREFTENCSLGGYHIKKGTRLIPNLWKIHRDPNVWSDPLEFKPERFFSTHKDIDVRGHNFELLPFGSGRRICAGMSLGMHMVHFTLANFLHSFEILNPSTEPIDMTEIFGFTNTKATPLEILVKPHLSPNYYETYNPCDSQGSVYDAYCLLSDSVMLCDIY